ncbi:transport and Golgi organization protein 1 homolog [Polyodon spathula]|uniref:transport and Golgi organization protein 1 homolog n=2 Tax=Polyodon spathula TaxID=7913 RepID=UPI001B7E5C56|nr:transport and Golgi organization protein 1 homolog [Polyodon spathula]
MNIDLPGEKRLHKDLLYIASYEKKAHENWLKARAAERTLVEEKRETSNLRQKLVEVNDKLKEIQRTSLIKSTPGRPDRQIPPPHRGTLNHNNCYGPPPLSGGDPSHPPMIEGPGHPPSAPVGRREPFGHMDGQFGPRRPPPETSTRFSGPERGLPPPFRADVGECAPPLISSGPRTSSPSIPLDDSQIPVEPQALSSSPPKEPATMNSKAEDAPSFPGAPIMNSPVTGPAHPPPSKGFAPPPMTRPPNGYGPLPFAGHPLPVPGPRYRPPHPVRGPYGRMLYGPAPPWSGCGPPPPHRDYWPGPPPPFGLRDFAPGMRDLPSGFPPPHGPWDYPFPPKNMLPGAVPPPGMRDYPGPQGPPPQMGPRDFKAGPPVPQQMSPRDYPPGPSLPTQQMQPGDFSNSQNGP